MGEQANFAPFRFSGGKPGGSPAPQGNCSLSAVGVHWLVFQGLGRLASPRVSIHLHPVAYQLLRDPSQHRINSEMPGLGIEVGMALESSGENFPGGTTGNDASLLGDIFHFAPGGCSLAQREVFHFEPAEPQAAQAFSFLAFQDAPAPVGVEMQGACLPGPAARCSSAHRSAQRVLTRYVFLRAVCALGTCVESVPHSPVQSLPAGGVLHVFDSKVPLSRPLVRLFEIVSD